MFGLFQFQSAERRRSGTSGDAQPVPFLHEMRADPHEMRQFA
jgi:hypothetical protein